MNKLSTSLDRSPFKRYSNYTSPVNRSLNDLGSFGPMPMTKKIE